MRNFNIKPVLATVGGLVLTGVIFLQMGGSLNIPESIPLGPVTLHLYGLILVIALMVAVKIGLNLASEYGENEQVKNIDMWQLSLWLFVPALIGARVYHVVTDWQLYQTGFTQVLNITNGGLGFIGGLVGGAVGFWVFTKVYKLDWTRFIAPAAVAVPIGQAIGRLGNLINQELYGKPVEGIWGLYVKPENLLPGYAGYRVFHPLFLYEAIANLGLAVLLYRAYRSGIRSPRLFGYYLAGYGVIRFLLDFYRIDGKTGIAGLSYTQWLILTVFVLCVVFGICFQIWFKRKFGLWFTRHQQLEERMK